MFKYKENMIKRIINNCNIPYEKISKSEMILGDSYYNNMCHMNSVQYIKQGKATESYLCVAVYDDFAMVHFINKDKKGNFVDNTLGWQYEYYDYYIIRKVREDEYYNIWKLLNSTKKMLIENNTSKIGRFINRIDYRKDI